MKKMLLTLKPFVTPGEKKLRYCITCDSLATQEACFDVGENISVIEKYCDSCARKVMR